MRERVIGAAAATGPRARERRRRDHATAANAARVAPWPGRTQPHQLASPHGGRERCAAGSSRCGWARPVLEARATPSRSSSSDLPPLAASTPSRAPLPARHARWPCRENLARVHLRAGAIAVARPPPLRVAHDPHAPLPPARLLLPQGADRARRARPRLRAGGRRPPRPRLARRLRRGLAAPQVPGAPGFRPRRHRRRIRRPSSSISTPSTAAA